MRHYRTATCVECDEVPGQHTVKGPVTHGFSLTQKAKFDDRTDEIESQRSVRRALSVRLALRRMLDAS